MLSMTSGVLRAITSHALADLPNEACGYLAGKDGMITVAYRLTNTDRSPEHFSFDPAEQFNTLNDARSRGLDILANYHSHPSSPARPSGEDVRLAFDPGISYVIVSLAGQVPDIRSFSIKDGVVEREKIEIVNQ